MKEGVLRIEEAVGLLGARSSMALCGRFEATIVNSASASDSVASFMSHLDMAAVERNTQVHHNTAHHKVTIDSCKNQTIVYPEPIHKSLRSYLCH